jgi:hypothetical protein
METIFGLQQGYLAALPYLMWVWGLGVVCALLVVAGGICRLLKWRHRAPLAARHHRECVTPLAVMALGLALLGLPGWRGLDVLLGEVDLALLGCFWQAEDRGLPPDAGTVSSHGPSSPGISPPPPGGKSLAALPVHIVGTDEGQGQCNR